MGYTNQKTGTLREVRRQQRRQATEAPVGQTSIGHGSGLRIYDEGRIILDGSDLQVIQEIRDGVAFIRFYPLSRGGLLADPAFWADENVFVAAGPRRSDSTAASGFGGSNLYLQATSAFLASGIGSSTSAQVTVTDTGRAAMSGPKGDMTIEPDGAWSSGDRAGAVIQGIAGGGMRLYGGGARITSFADFRVEGDQVVTGSKNFIMDHPGQPGYTIKYGATESPVSAIECRGRVTIGEDGTAPIEYPEHFAAIVKPDTDVDVSLTAYGPDPAWCDEPTRTGTTAHGTPGVVVAWKAYAERSGGDFVVVEPADAPPTGPAPSPSQAPPDEPATDDTPPLIGDMPLPEEETT